MIGTLDDVGFRGFCFAADGITRIEGAEGYLLLFLAMRVY